MAKTAQEILKLARSYNKTLESILPKITPETAVTQSGPKTLGWFLQILQWAWAFPNDASGVSANV